MYADYLSQGDFRQPNFKKVFYGSNYDALRKIKAKYDPNSVLYGKTNVGSDEWREREDGRLCQVSQWQSDWVEFGTVY